MYTECRCEFKQTKCLIDLEIEIVNDSFICMYSNMQDALLSYHLKN